MALSDHKKKRFRHVIRTSMITLAVVLLVIAIAIPVANNAIALGVENRLKDLPLPDGAQKISSVSSAGDLSGMHNGIQYFGAILVQSNLSKDEVFAHYAPYRQQAFDCIVADAFEARTILSGMPLEDIESSFAADAIQDDWYLIYSWGNPPDWLWDILNLDSRSR